MAVYDRIAVVKIRIILSLDEQASGFAGSFIIQVSEVVTVIVCMDDRIIYFGAWYLQPCFYVRCLCCERYEIYFRK